MFKLTKQSGIYIYPANKMLFVAALCSQLFTSCVNDIPGEEAPDSGDIPISLTTSIKSLTRITENGFDKDESIGLYIMVEPAKIDNTRYIDNMQFTCGTSGFSPKETIYFPEGDNSCNFTSYYPYREKAISKGESKINVEVQADQSTKAAYSTSNFMVATKNEVTATKKAVNLDFQHKMCRLSVQIKTPNGRTPKELLEANPTVKIKDVYSKATYDINTGSFTGLNSKTDIIPYGDWSIKGDTLYGKNAIIIPQEIAKSHIIIEVYVEGVLFECEFEEAPQIDSGTVVYSTIELNPSDDAIRSTIATSIGDWIPLENSLQGNATKTFVQISKLDFAPAKNSRVLKVINKDKQVAEICHEYLCNDQITRQAIVIYPTKDGKTDLTKGLVLELKKKTEEEELGEKHGGTIAWDITSNTFTYTEGTSEKIEYIYITSNGDIKTIRPENALQLQIKPDKLIDNRGLETQEYAIVKIGTQYWLRGNLKTTKYTDGTEIGYGGEAKLGGGGAVASNTAPQYYDYKNTYLFYNAASIATEKLIASGWRIGTESDYTILKTYIQDDASVLKHGDSWISSTHLYTNLTGFNIIAAGHLKGTYTSNSETSSYWCANNNTSTIVNKAFTLSVDNNKTNIADATIADMALNIRCIRE